MTTDQIKSKLKNLFQNNENIGIVYLYGSQARGEANEGSDYDFAVFFDEKDPAKRGETLFTLSAAAMRELKTDLIDMHSLNDLANPELKYHIIKDGIVLFEREPFRILIEPRILNEYFDHTYLLRKYGFIKTRA